MPLASKESMLQKSRKRSKKFIHNVTHKWSSEWKGRWAGTTVVPITEFSYKQIQSDTLGTFRMPTYRVVYLSDKDSEELEEQQVRLLFCASALASDN